MRLISFRSLITVFCILWTAQCVLTAFNAGKNQHLDGAVNYGAIVDIWAIGIAISQGAYGFYEGYVGRPEVVQALADHIAPEGLYALSDRQQALAGSKEAIERGIQAAIALDPAKMMPYEGTVRAPFAIIPGDNGVGAVGKVEATCQVTLTCSDPWWWGPPRYVWRGSRATCASDFAG